MEANKRKVQKRRKWKRWWCRGTMTLKIYLREKTLKLYMHHLNI